MKWFILVNKALFPSNNGGAWDLTLGFWRDLIRHPNLVSIVFYDDRIFRGLLLWSGCKANIFSHPSLLPPLKQIARRLTVVIDIRPLVIFISGLMLGFWGVFRSIKFATGDCHVIDIELLILNELRVVVYLSHNWWLNGWRGDFWRTLFIRGIKIVVLDHHLDIRLLVNNKVEHYVPSSVVCRSAVSIRILALIWLILFIRVSSTSIVIGCSLTCWLARVLFRDVYLD